MMPTVQGLVEDAMCIYQGGMPMYGGDAAYKWHCAWILILPYGIINQ